MKFNYAKNLKGFTTGFLTIALSIAAHAQISIFSENMGSTPVSSNTGVASYTGFQNSGGTVTYTGTADVRTTTASNTYAGASGGNNVFLTTTNGVTFQINNININGASNLSISFGITKSTNAENGSGLTVQAVVDGGAPINIPIVMNTGTGTTAWTLITPAAAIPTGNSLSLSFTRTSGSASFRIDDVNITSGTPLPVTFASFSLKPVQGGVQLNWATGTEKNTSRFEVQRSEDGTSFNAIGTVAARNIATGAQYSYTDRNVQGTAYYRLRIIDADEQFAYSDVLSYNAKSTAATVSLKANVVNGQLPVLVSTHANAVTLRIVNMAGIALQQQTVAAGTSSLINMDVNGLPAGMYLLQVAGQDAPQTFKFVKQ